MDITNSITNMNIRSFIFWLKDALGGYVIKKHVQDIYSFLVYGNGENEAQLERILQWSVGHTAFYSKYKGFKSVEEFPVINKSIIRENEDQFLAFGFNKASLFKEETSGSTGTPFIVYQDSRKRKRSAADTIAFSKFAGYEFGTRLYYSRVWNARNRKSSITSAIQNIKMVESSKLADEDLRSFLDILEKDHSTKSVLIFASSLTALYQYMKDHERTTSAKVECFITMSESLPTKVRKGIEELFHTTVVSRYSNCECGILAQQSKESDEYSVNTGSFYVEILKMDEDVPADEGELGRIVVTDLFNKAMPLIRYDTGDIGAYSHSPSCGKGGKVLVHVGGRRVDAIWNTRGEMISPYVINNTMVG